MKTIARPEMSFFLNGAASRAGIQAGSTPRRAPCLDLRDLY